MRISLTQPFRTDLEDNYTFVNNIRHWSMMAVILLHSLGCAQVFGPVVPSLVYVLIEIGKFGTIGFFVISGFLLGERFAPTNRLDYVKRRLDRIAAPWALWFCLFCLLKSARDIFLSGANGTRLDFQFLQHTIVFALFQSAYWFVPSLIISLCVLLLFYRQIGNWRFGAAAFVVSLFYGINVYGHWWPTQHSYALLGFLSYLWLGAWAARNRRLVNEFVAAIPFALLLFVAAAFCSLSYFETRALLAIGNPDSVNTLRISNQAYSLVVVLLFLKLPNVVWPRFVSVREHTFGLYLIHAPVVGILVKIIRSVPLFNRAWFQSGPGIISLVLLLFVCTYSISGALTMWLSSRAKFAWMVGARPSTPKFLTMPEAVATPELVEVEG